MQSKNSNHKKKVRNSNEISLLDIAVEFVNNFNLIIKIIIAFLFIGLLIILIKPKNFTATSKVVAEIDNLASPQLSSGLNALKSYGFNIGNVGSGLTPESYPNLIKSREVLYILIHQPFLFKSIDSTMKFVDYANYKDFRYYLKKYTYKLPSTIIGFFKPNLQIGNDFINLTNILSLNEKESKAISLLMDEMVKTHIDHETGIITINTTTNDRYLSTILNSSIIVSFQNRIRQIYNQKNSENLKFIQSELDSVETELRNSEQAVVEFLERNNNPQTIQLQTILERLKRNVAFNADLYSELQIQYYRTKIELKKKEPIIRILERPTPPINPSGIGKITSLILFIFIGLLVSLIIIFYKFIMKNLRDDEVNKEKLDHIRQAFFKNRFFK